MSYTTAEGRQQVLDTLAKAIDELALALTDLGEAYEQLDEHSADELERLLFRPVRSAYARARRTHAEFAQRHELPTRAFDAAVRGAPSHGARGFVDDAVSAVVTVDAELAELQDSMLPVEVGDAELRAGLGEVRTLLGGVGPGARELTRTLGR